MNVTVILADAAQEAAGKLFVLGGGWSFIGPDPGPMGVALLVLVDWNEANEPHEFLMRLEDEDGNLATFGPESSSVEVRGHLEVGRPPGHPAGIPFNVPMAVNFPPLPLDPGRRYVWVVSIDGNSQPHWRAGFNTRPRPDDNRPPGPNREQRRRQR
jgi:hypothetical protein